MSEHYKKAPIIHLLGLLIYIPIQIVFIPIALVAMIPVVYKQAGVSAKLGTSSTALEVLQGRLHMHWFGLRDDPPTNELSKVLPNFSALGHWTLLLPLYILYKISGKIFYPVIAAEGEEEALNLVSNRTIYFDELINSRKGQAEQFVVLGAGFDTRCYGLLKASHLRLFELDQSATQQLKIQQLNNAQVDCSSVTFAEADFTKKDWFQRLEEAGYDPSKKTIFLWEGVTLYLSEVEVRNTLKAVKANSAAGSVVIADLYGFDFLKSLKKTSKLLEAMGESLGGFGLDFSADHENALSKFAVSENATSGKTYFMGNKTKKGVWMVVTEILF